MLTLVATNNHLVAKTIAKQLLQLDQACVCAYSFEEASLIYKNQRPDKVIIDVALKSESGLTLTQLIRKEYQSVTPLLLLGKINVQSEIEQQLAEGANASLTYPFQTRQFSEAFKKL
ncbi:MAG: response regulator [Vicingaceae bacterium]